jgi:hypothetical protein
MKTIVLALLLLVVQDAPKRGQIVSSADKSQDFAAISTYAWEKGAEAFDRTTHQALVDAVEAELSARGLRKAADVKSADVTVAYYATGTSEVDFDELDKARGKEIPPSKSVATLGLAMYRLPARTRIWTAQTRQFVDVSPAKRDATARTLVASLFETLPRKKK